MDKVGKLSPELERILVQRIAKALDKARYAPAEITNVYEAAREIVRPYTTPLIRHYATCTADYPEKQEGEAPQALTRIDLDDGTEAVSCNDCGAYIIERKGARDVLL